MNYEKVTKPESLPGDENGFAEDAFRRVGAVCKQGDIETLDELRRFLAMEAAECDRKATYLRGMTKYFHENAAVAQEFEAQALRLMLGRLDQSEFIAGD